NIISIAMKKLGRLKTSNFESPEALNNKIAEELFKAREKALRPPKFIEKTAPPQRTDPLTNTDLSSPEVIKRPENRHYPLLSSFEKQSREEGYLFEPYEILEVNL